MAKNLIDPLSQLRDLHLPPPISAWPLAPGWWVVMLLVALSVVGLMSVFLKKKSLRRARKTALLQVNKWQSLVAQGKMETIFFSELSCLLRRLSFLLAPREKIAGLQGELWLRWLDQQFGAELFLTPAGKLLLTVPYQQQVDKKAIVLLSLTSQWIKRCIR